MPALIRGIRIAIATALVVAFAAHAAAAGRLGILNAERGFRIEWTTATISAAGRSIQCPLTLEGTFGSASFTKRAGTRIGAVTSAARGTCATGRATVLTETLPWSLNYSSYTGTLPVITRVLVTIVGLAIQVETEGVTCLLRTETSQPQEATAELFEGQLIFFSFNSGFGITTSGGFLCSFTGPATISGTGVAHVRGGIERSLVLLI